MRGTYLFLQFLRGGKPCKHRNVISGVVDSIAHGAGWGWGQTEAPPGGTATPLLRLTAVWYDFLVEVRNQIFKNTWKSSFKNIGS